VLRHLLLALAYLDGKGDCPCQCCATHLSSTTRRKRFLDLIHERVHQSGLAQLGEVLEHNRLPALVALHFLRAAVAQIERPRLVQAAEKHERVGAVRADPYLLGRKRDGLVGGIERLAEVARENESKGEGPELGDADLERVLPLRVSSIGRGQVLSDGEALAAGCERLVELPLSRARRRSRRRQPISLFGR